MSTRAIQAAVLAVSLASVHAPATAAGGAIPAHQVADMLYALALANRTVYTRDIVQRLGPADAAVLPATEHYLDAKALPLPAQMFSLSTAARIQTRGRSKTRPPVGSGSGALSG